MDKIKKAVERLDEVLHLNDIPDQVENLISNLREIVGLDCPEDIDGRYFKDTEGAYYHVIKSEYMPEFNGYNISDCVMINAFSMELHLDGIMLKLQTDEEISKDEFLEVYNKFIDKAKCNI